MSIRSYLLSRQEQYSDTARGAHYIGVQASTGYDISPQPSGCWTTFIPSKRSSKIHDGLPQFLSRLMLLDLPWHHPHLRVAWAS
jgi:hypothetical protein